MTASPACTYMAPFVAALVRAAQFWALHVPGGNNPTGIEAKRREEGNAAFDHISPPRTCSREP